MSGRLRAKLEDEEEDKIFLPSDSDAESDLSADEQVIEDPFPDEEDSDSDAAPDAVSFKTALEDTKSFKRQTTQVIKTQLDERRKKRKEIHEQYMLQKEEKRQKIDDKKLPDDILESLKDDPLIESHDCIEDENRSEDESEEVKEIDSESLGTHGPTMFKCKVLALESKKPKYIPQQAASFKDNLLYGGRIRREKNELRVLTSMSYIMSSSDDTADVEINNKKAERSVFVKLLSQNPVVVEKSRTPKAMAAKKKAWEIIGEEYSRVTGKKSTQKGLLKMLNNMKTKIKSKTDKKATGNRKIILNDWEKGFLTILSQDESPEFQKVPGNSCVGVGPTNSNSTDIAEPCTSQTIATQFVRKGTKRLSLQETEETRDLSTPQLQRAVLLQQFKLQKIQNEKEHILLNNLKKMCNDASTDTDDLVYM